MGITRAIYSRIADPNDVVFDEELYHRVKTRNASDGAYRPYEGDQYPSLKDWQIAELFELRDGDSILPSAEWRLKLPGEGDGYTAQEVVSGKAGRLVSQVKKVASLRDKLEAEAALPGGLEVVNQAIAAFKDVG